MLSYFTLWETESATTLVRVEADGTYSFEHPYGTIPRLLLTWLATEAVRTKSAELMLGENLADFMGQLGLVPRGGVRGDIARLRSQMNRLFAARITIEDYGDARRDLGVQLQVGFLKDLWWSDTDRNADQRSLLPSTVRLSAEFFKHSRRRQCRSALTCFARCAVRPSGWTSTRG